MRQNIHRNWLVLGVGKDAYAQAAKEFPEKMEIVAIADIDPAKLKEVAEEFHIPQER